MSKTLDEFLVGDTSVAVYRHGSGWSNDVPARPIVLCGSFRPLHRAHRKLLAAGADTVNAGDRPRCFELSIANVEKPSLVEHELLERVGQFSRPDDTVLLTHEAMFVRKSQVLGATTFVVGYDTVVRLLDPRFYADAGGASAIAPALRELRARGCDFAVGGRHVDNGDFLTLHHLELPAEFADMFTPIPSDVFSDAISSTQIRNSIANRG